MGEFIMKQRIWKELFFILCLIILISSKTTAYAHTHTADCYATCTGVDYNGDGVINDNDCIAQYWSEQYADGYNYICRGCNQIIHTVGYRWMEGNLSYVYPHGKSSILICNNVDLTSIKATSPVQLVAKGGSIVATATATYSDGTKKSVTCTYTGYNANTLSTQSVTLSYTDKGITATTVISVTVSQTNHTHTDACFVQCTGLDYNGDGVFNDDDCLAQAASCYGAVGNNYICRGCNQIVHFYGGGAYGGACSYSYPHGLDRTKPICLAYTTAPSISFVNMNGNTALCEGDSSFYLQIKVGDNEGDTLFCSYYVDGSSVPGGTMLVNGTYPNTVATFGTPINANTLTEGKHVIKITAKDCVAPVGEANLSIYVDKTKPTINSVNINTTTKTANITVSASDAGAGLAPAAYRFTCNGTTSEWLTSNIYTPSGLSPSTNYNLKVEVKDKVGHIATNEVVFQTKLDIPTITASPIPGGYMTVSISDSNNHNTTLYKIKVGDTYIKNDWMNLNNLNEYNGQAAIADVGFNTMYNITVYALDIYTEQIVESTTISALSGPASVTTMTAKEVTISNVRIEWNNAAGANYYSLFRLAYKSDGSYLSYKEYPNIVLNSFNDTDVTPDTTYKYFIETYNVNGVPAHFSQPEILLEVKTPPSAPVKVTGLDAQVTGATLNLSWTSIPTAIGYEVIVSSDGTDTIGYYTANQCNINTGKLNSQCSVKVRAFNMFDEKEPTNSAKWSNAGEWSDIVTYYTQVNTPIMNVISMEQITYSSIQVSWQVNSNPSSVKYILGIFKDNVLVNSIEINGLPINNGVISYNINNLNDMTTYTFKVKACSINNVETGWSNEVSATTKIGYPSIPGRLRATATNNKITLAWDASNKAQSYVIQRNGVTIATGIKAVSYVDTVVTPETTYTYYVQAVNTTGESSWSDKLEKKTLGNLLPAPVPTVKKVSGSNISLKIEWTPVDGATGYDIDVDGVVYNTGMDTYYEHNGLIPGSKHTYRVRTRNIYGKGDWSVAITGEITPNAPEIPVSLSCYKDNNIIIIRWKAVSSAISYEVMVNGKTYSNITASEFIYTADNGNTDTECIIYVRAINEGGESDWSTPYTVNLSENSTLPTIYLPSVPQPVVTASGSSIVYVEWEECAGATSYQLEADGNIIYSGANPKYIHIGLLENSVHQYRVRAGNISGYSEWSEPVSVVTKNLITTSPQNITYYRKNDTTTGITWDKVEGVTEYKIEVNGVVSDTKFTVNLANIITAPDGFYNIRVAAIVENSGTSSLDWSDMVTFKAPSLLPEVPSVGVVVATGDAITISWNKVEGAKGYEVEADGKVVNVGDVTTYKNSGLTPSSSHTYRIRSYNSAGESNWSTSKTVMADAGIPGVPINIICEPVATVSVATGCAIQIKWDTINGATSYEVEDNNGKVRVCTGSSITIDNLAPGVKCEYRVRAITKTGAGAYSSKISVIPVITEPLNVKIKAENGKVRITWDKVGGATSYEIEINGVIVDTTQNNFLEYDYADFYMKRAIRIRGCNGTQYGNWSKPVVFDQPLPVEVTTYAGEEFAIQLPVSNVTDVQQYKLTLTFNASDLELVDACELTAEKELTSTFIGELNTNIIIEKSGDICTVTIIMNDISGENWTGIADSIRVRSKVDGKVTITYGVTLK